MVLLVPLESRVRRETVDCLGLMDLLGLRERLECPEAPAHSALLVPLDCLDNKVSRELKALLEELDQRERRVFKDPLDLLGHQVKSSNLCRSREVPNPNDPSMLVRLFQRQTQTCLLPMPLAQSSSWAVKEWRRSLAL